jgi:hypothetical protein
MVLVDPEPEHEERRLETVSPGFTLRIKNSIEASRACLRAVEAGVPAPGSKAAADCVDAPDPEFPSAVNDHLKQISSHPPFWRAYLSEQEEAIGAGSDQVEASKRTYGDLPLIVLTSSAAEHPDPNHPDLYYDARNRVVDMMHDEMAQLSSRGVNRIVPGATHHIMLTVPQAVIGAVNEVVADARRGHAGAQPKE